MAKRARLLHPMSVGSILQEGVLGRRTSDLLTLYQVQRAWVSVVGNPCAQNTFPKKIQRGVLIISSQSPAWAQTAQMMSAEILSKIQNQIGKRFKAIRFMTDAG